MDKFLNNNWVVKIISFVIALMLYAIVSAGQGTAPGPTGVAVNTDQQTSVITEKLDVNYDQSKYVVSGAPQTVSVRLTGSGQSILRAKLPSMKSAYLDLTGLKPGTYDVRVQTKGFPSGLTVRTTPQTVRVTIQKKTSKEFPVAIDVANKNAPAAGYSVGDPVLDTKNVTVTGGEEAIDSIALVKGVINVKGANADIDKKISLHAYNNDGDQVPVNIDPSSVRVRVPVEQNAKQMGIEAVTTGTPARGHYVSSVTLSADEVTVSAANAEALAKIATLEPLSVSVSGLKQDKTFSVRVPLPDGATKVTPETIDVTVHLADTATSSSASASSSSTSSSSSSESSTDEQQTKKFTHVPVKMTGLKKELTATFNSADDVTVSVTGPSRAVSALSADDMQASIDLSDLDEGSHQVAVTVKVPKGLSAEAAPEKIGVTISKD